MEKQICSKCGKIEAEHQKVGKNLDEYTKNSLIKHWLDKSILKPEDRKKLEEQLQKEYHNFQAQEYSWEVKLDESISVTVNARNEHDAAQEAYNSISAYVGSCIVGDDTREPEVTKLGKAKYG